MEHKTIRLGTLSISAVKVEKDFYISTRGASKALGCTPNWLLSTADKYSLRVPLSSEDLLKLHGELKTRNILAYLGYPEKTRSIRIWKLEHIAELTLFINTPVCKQFRRQFTDQYVNAVTMWATSDAVAY